MLFSLPRPTTPTHCRAGILFGLTALALLGMAGTARPGEPARSGEFKVRAVKDLVYYDGPGADKLKHRLDLFLPEGQKGYPVLFFVHGGAWLRGDKSFLGIYTTLGSFFARHGVGAVVINYRLSPAVKHPEHVRDVARAFAWTHKNIARYGGRADRIFVCGHSAGAHLVALLCADESYLKAEGLTVRAVKGAVALSGIYRLPPFLLMYADHDFPGCGRETAEEFCKALKARGNAVKSVEVAKSNHYKMVLSVAVPGEPVSRAVLDFIARNAGRP